MPVPSRIKIIQVNSLDEVESKVNDFLAFDKNIVHLVNIDYRLESGFVIIEYFVMMQKEEKDDNNNNNMWGCCWGDNTYSVNPITYWWDLCFPFLPNSF